MEREILLSLHLRTIHYQLLMDDATPPTLNNIILDCPAPLRTLRVAPGTLSNVIALHLNNFLFYRGNVFQAQV